MVGVGGTGSIQRTAYCPGPSPVGVGGMSAIVDTTYLVPFVALSGMAAISGLALLQAIKEEDALLAYTWGTMFGATSLAAAWSFWRMV